MFTGNTKSNVSKLFALAHNVKFCKRAAVVEPIAAGITILMSSYISKFLPYVLAFAAGAMLYVVVEELIPEASEGEHSNIATVGFAVGFVLMMILDVALA